MASLEDDRDEAASAAASDLKVLFEAELAGLSPSGTVFTHGSLPAAFAPTLTVSDVGTLEWPLSTAQFAALHAAARVAPFGKGFQTVIDPTVRSAKELDPSVVVLGPDWGVILRSIVSDVCSKLGIPRTGVTAEMYKMLLYSQGDFFKPHQDTEKAPGMFGTLIVQLPALQEGGTLRGHLHGERFKHDFGGPTSASTVQYAAFYADCTHELTPITSGHRITLAYNLTRTAAPTAGSADAAAAAGSAVEPTSDLRVNSSIAAAAQRLSAAAAAWGVLAPAVAPSFLTWPCTHSYTQTNAAFHKLKGVDGIVAAALGACPQLDVFLTLITKHVSGDAEEDGGGWGRRDRYASRKRVRQEEGSEEDDEADGADDGAHHAMTEVYENTTEAAGKWSTICGGSVAVDHIKWEQLQGALIPTDAELFHSEANPDKEAYEAYTGNAGPTVEYWYHRALFVIVPRNRSPPLLRASGSATAAIGLAKLRLHQLAAAGRMLPGGGGGATGGGILGDGTAAVQAVTSVPCAATGPYADAVAALRAAAIALRSRPLVVNPQSTGYVRLALRHQAAASEWCEEALALIPAAQAAGLPDADVVDAFTAVTAGIAAASRELHDDAVAALAAALNAAVACHARVQRAPEDGAAAEPAGPIAPTALVQVLDTKDVTSTCTSAASSADTSIAAASSSPSPVTYTASPAVPADGPLFTAATGAASSAAAIGELSPPLAAIVAFARCRASAHTPWLLKFLHATPEPLRRTLAPQMVSITISALVASSSNDAASALTAYLWGDHGGIIMDPATLTAHRHSFAAVARSSAAANNLLSAVLSHKAVLDAAKAGDADAISLVQARIDRLMAAGVLQPVTSFSWCMPAASLPGYPQVEAFLRGPQHSARFAFFKNLSEARRWASNSFGGGYGYSGFRYGYGGGSGYSASAVPDGRGATAYCTVTKTTAMHDAAVAQRKNAAAEVAQLREVLGQQHTVEPAAGSGNAKGTVAGPAAATTDEGIRTAGVAHKTPIVIVIDDDE